jgi:hypothetical protein
MLGVKVAASTVWEILKEAGIDPAPDRATTTWSAFLRSQAEAILACDFLETVTLTGQRQYILAVIEHATRRIRILGATAHPTADWVTQAARNLVMDLQDAGAAVKHLIRDRDGKYPPGFDVILQDAGIQVVLSGVRVPRMNSVMERWVLTCRRELLDRVLIWNTRHLVHVLRHFEIHYNTHRPHQGLDQAAPLRAVPPPITDLNRINQLNILRDDYSAEPSTNTGMPPELHGRILGRDRVWICRAIPWRRWSATCRRGSPDVETPAAAHPRRAAL